MKLSRREFINSAEVNSLIINLYGTLIDLIWNNCGAVATKMAAKLNKNPLVLPFDEALTVLNEG